MDFFCDSIKPIFSPCNFLITRRAMLVSPLQASRSGFLPQLAVSLESSSKLERMHYGAGSHWWRGWPEGSEVFQPECTDARPGNHKTGENLSKPEPYDQKRYRKQLCQESFLLLAGTLSFWGSLSQLPEQMLSPKEPLLKLFFFALLWGGPTGGWEWVAVSFLLSCFFLLAEVTIWLFTLILKKP